MSREMLPQLRRSLEALLPAPRGWAGAARDTLAGTVVAALGLFGLAPSAPARALPPIVVPATAGGAATERGRKVARLMLALTATPGELTASHRSHSSHSSHSSHYSSHSSPSYPSSPRRSEPAPLYVAPTPAPSPTPSPRAAAVPEPAAAARGDGVLTVDKVDPEHRRFWAHDDASNAVELTWDGDTRIETRVDDLMAARLPLVAGQKLQVEWRLAADRKSRIAVRIRPAE